MPFSATTVRNDFIISAGLPKFTQIYPTATRLFPNVQSYNEHSPWPMLPNSALATFRMAMYVRVVRSWFLRKFLLDLIEIQRSLNDYDNHLSRKIFTYSFPIRRQFDQLKVLWLPKARWTVFLHIFLGVLLLMFHWQGKRYARQIITAY